MCRIILGCGLHGRVDVYGYFSLQTHCVITVIGCCCCYCALYTTAKDVTGSFYCVNIIAKFVGTRTLCEYNMPTWLFLMDGSFKESDLVNVNLSPNINFSPP